VNPPPTDRFGNRILVYTPQIVENYQLQSGEGLSVLFILIWLAGDICNLLGAVIAGLIPTVIILAIYVRGRNSCDKPVDLTLGSIQFAI